MKTSVSPQRSTTGRAFAQGRNRKRIREPRGNMPRLTRAINQIEKRTGRPFEEWICRVTADPAYAVVHQENADCFVVKLMDITGNLVLEEIPMKRGLYDAMHAAITARGVALHQFIMEAVERQCLRVNGGAR